MQMVIKVFLQMLCLGFGSCFVLLFLLQISSIIKTYKKPPLDPQEPTVKDHVQTGVLALIFAVLLFDLGFALLGWTERPTLMGQIPLVQEIADSRPLELRIADQAVKNAPHLPSNWEMRAKEHLRLHDFEKAAADFGQAAVLYRERNKEGRREEHLLIKCLERRALALKDAGDLRQAVADLTEVHDLSVKMPRSFAEVILLSRAQLHEEIGNHEAAKMDILSAARLYLKMEIIDPTALEAFAGFYERRGDPIRSKLWQQAASDFQAGRLTFDQVRKMLDDEKK